MNLYQKMSAITGELNAVAKNLFVGEGKSQYKAVGEADVLAAVKPLEQKYGIYSYPVNRTIVDHDLVTTTKSYNGQTTESTKYFLRIETEYRFVDIDKPEDYIDIKTYGDGIDSQDKAPGKAMTYGDKYALLKAYKIITGDDPDQHYSEDTKTERQPKITVNDREKEALIAQAKRTGVAMTGKNGILAKYGVTSINDLTIENYMEAMQKLNAMPSRA